MAEIKIDTGNVSDKELAILSQVDQALVHRSQLMRLWSMLVVAPLLISSGRKAKGISSFHKRILRSAGWGTLIVNGFQYYKTLRLEKVAISTPKVQLPINNKDSV